MQALNLKLSDWNGTQTLDLSDVSPETTAGEILADVTDYLHLSPGTPYHLIYQGQKLNRSSSLEEVGVEDGDEVVIAPEVSAGSPAVFCDSTARRFNRFC
jgi:hypothetical protein